MIPSREETQAKMDLLGQGQSMYSPEDPYTIADRFEELAASSPDHVFLIDGDEKITFADINREANRYAALARKLGLKQGDAGAVMLENRFEFFYAWLGLIKAGATAAMINTFAKEKALAHALNVTESKLLFVGEECLHLFEDQPELLSQRPSFAVRDQGQHDLVGDAEWIDAHLPEQSDNPPAEWREGNLGSMPAFYVFTSGTTGLPKAAIISHTRWLCVGAGWAKALGITPEDVFYCVLPLFHGAAGMSLTSNVLSGGASMVLRRKFSASKFWGDVRKHGVTTTQYIGEITRYLINQPPSEDDKNHTLVRMTGAGMTPDVWKKFLARFGEQIQIFEGLGATESNCGITNLDGRIGSVGRVPFKEKSNARVLKYDIENGCHVRDENGNYVEAKAGEVGELVGMIFHIPGIIGGRYEGYTDSAATEKKILRNVLQEGDAFFSTGDLVRFDEDDYYYFVDRIGDTFRWKSENVSTTEVTELLSPYEEAEMINVYGVQVPEHEGRAGMAAIQMRDEFEFDPKRFYQIATDKLPHYAVPLFLRVSSQSDLTPTFKLRKVDLQKQGYNPEAFSDPVYLLDHENETYSPYSEEGLTQLRIKPFAG